VHPPSHKTNERKEETNRTALFVGGGKAKDLRCRTMNYCGI
jgi:hypothetical protein